MEDLPMSHNDSEVERLMSAFATMTNEQDYDRIPALLSQDCVWRTPGAPGGEVHGRAAARTVVEEVTSSFPDFHVEYGDVFVEGNEGMATLHVTGTHEAEFLDVPPTNQTFELTGMSKTRVADGQLQEIHDVINIQEWLTQLGIVEE